MRFEGVTNAGQIGGDRSRVDVVTHENNVKRVCVDSRTDGTVMEFAKREI